MSNQSNEHSSIADRVAASSTLVQPPVRYEPAITTGATAASREEMSEIDLLHPLSSSPSRRSPPSSSRCWLPHPSSFTADNIPLSELEHELQTNRIQGLTQIEAERRLRLCGRNVLPTITTSLLSTVLHELKEPMIILLLLVGVGYAVWGSWLDACTAIIIVFATVAVEIATEMRAKKAVAKLSSLQPPAPAVVIRESKRVQISKEEVVPGDIMLVSAGDKIAADCRVADAKALVVDESVLTGESAGAIKIAQDVPVIPEVVAAVRSTSHSAGASTMASPTTASAAAAAAASHPSSPPANIIFR